MPFPSQPKWVIDEAIQLYQSGSDHAQIAAILASKGVVSQQSGVPCTSHMVKNWVDSARAKGLLPAKRKTKAGAQVILASPDPEDGDLALLRTILDSRSYDKPKKIKMFKNLISAMDA